MDIKDINAKIAELNEAKRKLEQESWTAANKPVARYEFDRCSIVKPSSFDDISYATECIRITERLVNKHEKDAWMDRYGSISGFWDEARTSVVYCRINGILCHASGGYLILKTPQPCSDSEWEQIKLGNYAKFVK
jgi:hypothetical protein